MMVPNPRMYNGDRSQGVLVDAGFRRSAMDLRPLKFPEFEKTMGITLYTSARLVL